MANRQSVEERSLEAIAELYMQWEADGRKFIDAPGVLEGIAEIVGDAGYYDEEGSD